MGIHDTLKRLRGDAHVRTQIRPLNSAVADLHTKIDELSERLRALPEPKVAARQKPLSRSAAVKLFSSQHPYMASVINAYDQSIAEWLSSETPWFTGGATRWLEEHLTNDDEVFEYGAGRSTVWWCKHVHSVVTLEASPEWIAYLNFYLGDRPELLAKLKMLHVPADWNPDAESGVKRYWGRRRQYLTPEVVDDLERKYLSVEPGAASVVSFDGSIRALTMASWILTEPSRRAPDIVVVDNTERGRASSMASAAFPEHVRLDFPFGPGDVVPDHQHGKHITTVFVAPNRMSKCGRGEALPDGTDLAPHQLNRDLDQPRLSRSLDEFAERLRELGFRIIDRS